MLTKIDIYSESILLCQPMYSCAVKMIWIFLVLSQLHFVYPFPTETAKNIEIAAPSFPDLDLIEPPVDFSDLEKGNEKIHKIVDSYRAVESDIAAQSNASDQSRQMVIIDHVSPDQRPPYGRPPLPPTVVEVFQRPSQPAHPPGRPIPFPPSRPASPHRPIPYPPFRPGLPPHGPALDLPNVPLPPDVEVFNQPSPNVPPDVEVFNPSDGRPIAFPTVADIQVPFDKNAIYSPVRANDSSAISNLSSILGIPEKSQESYLGDLSWNATKASADYQRLQRFLENEEGLVDGAPTSSTRLSLPEQKNVSGNAIIEPPVDSSTVSKESHEMNQNPPMSEDKSSIDAANTNLPSKMTYPPAKPTVVEERGEYEMLESTEASNEVNPPDENATPETLPIEFAKGAEPSPDDNLEVKKLIDHLLVEKTLSNAAPVDKLDKLDPIEFSIPQMATTEKMFLANESTKVEVSTEDSSTESINNTESNKMQPNSTYQISDVEISKDPIPPSISKPMSPQEYRQLCQLLAKYLLNKMQISAGSSEIISSDEDFEFMSPIMPSTYEEPLVTGRNADDNEELVSLLDSVDLVLPESSTNSDRSVFPDGSANEANSEFYLVSQPENVEFANSYLSPPEEIIVPYEFEGYA